MEVAYSTLPLAQLLETSAPGAPVDRRAPEPPSRQHVAPVADQTDDAGIDLSFASLDVRRDAAFVATEQAAAGVVSERVSFTAGRITVSEDGFSAEFVHFEQTQTLAFAGAASNGGAVGRPDHAAAGRADEVVDEAHSGLRSLMVQLSKAIERLEKLLDQLAELFGPVEDDDTVIEPGADPATDPEGDVADPQTVDLTGDVPVIDVTGGNDVGSEPVAA